MQHQPFLDGWRGLAILCVILYHLLLWHYNIRFGSVGVMGVELFFVLSGFLITKNLMMVSQSPSPGRSLGGFYIRRIFRIFPGLLVFFLALAILFSLKLRTANPISMSEWIACIFLWRNYYLNGHGITDHMWSLSVEEHSYLILGLIFYFIRKPILVIVGLLLVSIAIISLYLVHPGAMTLAASWRTEIRMFSPMCGALMALWVDHPNIRYYLRVAPASVILLIGIVIWSCAKLGIGSMVLGTPLFAIALGALYVQEKQSFLHRALSNLWLCKIGLISFSLYLWQQLMLQNIKQSMHSPLYLRVATSAVGLGLCLATASFCYRYVEKPIREKGRSLARKLEKNRLG